MGSAPDFRLPAIRSRDVILAALQAAFAHPNLLGANGNPYRFIASDPAGSPVWIASPEGRLLRRDGRRQLITVSRGEYVPQELHLHNLMGASISEGQADFSDLGSTMLMIQCEAGSETGSEVLASICYQVIKLFRQQIMRDYDIHNLKLGSISTPSPVSDAPGSPWVTVVMLRIEIQEHARMIEIGNELNRLAIETALQQLPTLEAVAAPSNPLPRFLELTSHRPGTSHRLDSPQVVLAGTADPGAAVRLTASGTTSVVPVTPEGLWNIELTIGGTVDVTVADSDTEIVLTFSYP